MTKYSYIRYLFLSLFFILTSCTATMSGGFEANPTQANQYTYRTYLGMLSDTDAAKVKAKQDIDLFMKAHQYQSYQVLHEGENWFPAYYEYTLQFNHGTNHEPARTTYKK